MPCCRGKRLELPERPIVQMDLVLSDSILVSNGGQGSGVGSDLPWLRVGRQQQRDAVVCEQIARWTIGASVPGPPCPSPARRPTPTGSDPGLCANGTPSAAASRRRLAAVTNFATHWNDNNPGTQLGGAPSEGSVTNSGTPVAGRHEVPGILQVVLHIGHVEIQDDQVRLQDVQVCRYCRYSSSGQ